MDRIWKICSDPNDSHEKRVSWICHRLWNRKVRVEATAQQQFIENEVNPIRFILLPYVSHKVDKFAKRLKKHVNSLYPKVDLDVGFKSSNETGMLLPFKNQMNNIQKESLVVYWLKWSVEGCNASYIGKTWRNLYHRKKEHKTGSELACSQH